MVYGQLLLSLRLEKLSAIPSCSPIYLASSSVIAEPARVILFNLSGSKALITGAGSPTGIGFASAKLLCQMGASVYITGASDRLNDRVSELTAEGFSVEGCVADLTEFSAAEIVVSNALAFLGGLDIVVNNAGMTSINAPMQEVGEAGDGASMSVDGWHNSIARNLNSAFYITKLSLPHLRQSSAGRLLKCGVGGTLHHLAQPYMAAALLVAAVPDRVHQHR